MSRQEYTGTYLNDQISKGYGFAHTLTLNGWTVKVDATEGAYGKEKKIIIQAFIEDKDEEVLGNKQLLNE